MAVRLSTLQLVGLNSLNFLAIPSIKFDCIISCFGGLLYNSIRLCVQSNLNLMLLQEHQSESPVCHIHFDSRQ